MPNHGSKGLPVKIDSASNGEFVPLAVPEHLRMAQDLAAVRITEGARQAGQSRRAFLASLCGVATTFAAFNEAFAARKDTGGLFKIYPDAPRDEAAAAQTVAGDEFIFDVQTHMLDPDGPWRQRPNGGQRTRWLSSRGQGKCGRGDAIDCYASDQFIKDIFLDSDTDMAVLSFMPGMPDDNPRTIEEAARTRRLIEALDGEHRLLLHAMVVPNAGHAGLGSREVERMVRAVEEWKIDAWKVYTQWGPQGRGWWLDDPDTGIPFIEQARALRVKTIATHKGISFGRFPPKYARCDDVGRIARAYPDVNFLIYHAGYEPYQAEGPFDPAHTGSGISSLVKSMLVNDIAPNSNVYAELGSTWRLWMRNPTGAAHALGKLLTYVGEDNVSWGTDSIWAGSPQDQIQAFRAFEIAPALQQQFGYPPPLRRRARRRSSGSMVRGSMASNPNCFAIRLRTTASNAYARTTAMRRGRISNHTGRAAGPSLALS